MRVYSEWQRPGIIEPKVMYEVRCLKEQSQRRVARCLLSGRSAKRVAPTSRDRDFAVCGVDVRAPGEVGLNKFGCKPTHAVPS